MLFRSDHDSLGSDHPESNARAATRIAERLSHGGEWAGGPRSRRGHRVDGDDEDGGYWLSIALPSVRRAEPSAGEPVLLVDGVGAPAVRVTSLLDDATVADAARERTALIARAITRAAAKYVVTKAVKDKNGAVAGSIANLGASLLERADVRSWHVLPHEVTLLRVHAPAGQHRLQFASGAGQDPIELGPVTVRAGAIVIVPVRLWLDHTTRVIAAR